MSRLVPLLLLLASPACSRCAAEPSPSPAPPVVSAVALRNLRAIQASRRIAAARAAAEAVDGGPRVVPVPVPAHLLHRAGEAAGATGK